MKMPIEWHEQNLLARRASLKSKKDQLQRLQDEVASNERSISELETQITYAKRQRKDGFDEEKFMKKKLNPSDV